jgi:hypothetical protein
MLRASAAFIYETAGRNLRQPTTPNTIAITDRMRLDGSGTPGTKITGWLAPPNIPLPAIQPSLLTRVRGRVLLYASLGRYRRDIEADIEAECGIELAGLPSRVIVGS